MLKLQLQYSGHQMRRTDSLEKTLMLEKIGGGRKGDDRGWDGWMASLTQWTWVWASSGSWYWIVKPGVLQAMGQQRVGQDWSTELNWGSPNLDELLQSLWSCLRWFCGCSSLTSFCLNPSFETQEMSCRLESCLQEVGNSKASVPRNPPGIYSASVPNSKHSTNLDILSLTLLIFKFLQSVKTYPSLGDFAFSQGPWILIMLTSIEPVPLSSSKMPCPQRSPLTVISKTIFTNVTSCHSG